MSERSKLVFEVLHDTDTDGPAGDGTVIARFRTRVKAEAFAKNRTCWGRPATVQETRVPYRLAARWGVA